MPRLKLSPSEKKARKAQRDAARREVRLDRQAQIRDAAAQQHSERRSSLAQRKRDSRKAQNKRISDAVRSQHAKSVLQDRRLAAQWKSNSWEQQQRTNAQAQPARGPCETPAQQPASEHGDAADQHAEASQVLESMQHGQDIEAQLDEVMQDADDADVAVQFAEANNPEQHAGMCQPGCSEAFGQAATGHEHQLGQDVPDSQQHRDTGGAGTSGRLNAANLQPPLRDLHLTGHVHDELAAAQPQVPPYSFDEARQLMLSHHAQRTLRALAALPAEETQKPWQLPYHSFQHDGMACSPAPVAFDMRQYMPQLTPVTGAEAALEWRNERIRYWQSLRTPKTVARHETLAEAVEQAASRGPSKQSAGHHMVALALDEMKFNLLHQRQRLRRGSPLRLPQLRRWMPFGLMRHRGLKRAPSVPLLSRSSAHLSASDCAVALVLPHPRSQWQV